MELFTLINLVTLVLIILGTGVTIYYLPEIAKALPKSKQYIPRIQSRKEKELREIEDSIILAQRAYDEMNGDDHQKIVFDAYLDLLHQKRDAILRNERDQKLREIESEIKRTLELKD